LGRIFGKTGKPIEFYAGDRARKEDKLNWEDWGKRFDFFLNHIVRICAPDHFIIGGGASKKFDKFEKQLTVKVPIHLAQFKNNAGIIGAAYAAAKNK
jgi:polyphosphate glucokinase